MLKCQELYHVTTEENLPFKFLRFFFSQYIEGHTAYQALFKVRRQIFTKLTEQYMLVTLNQVIVSILFVLISPIFWHI